MRITDVETVELGDLEFEETGWVGEIADDYRRLLFVRLHTDEGVTGLGETYPRPAVEAELVHRHVAPELLGTEPSPERIWRDVFRHANYWGGYGGTEMRALSAVDIALWDLRARAAGVPLYELLGGPVRDRLRTYNTCYEGEYSFAEEPVALAESLLEEGISAMKIWPYDDIAYANGGSYVSPAELRAGAEPLRAIREALGHEMDVAMEFHGLWDLQSAKRIARHLEQYDPMWLEEMLEVGNVDAYDRLARSTPLPVNVSERLMSKYHYEQLLSNVDVDVVMFDVEWMGGLTEARKVAAMAEANQVPVAPHNCGGPVLHFANLHLGATVPNLMVMESVRGRYDGWHRDLITTPAGAEDGELVVPDGPGLGTELSDEILEAEGVTRRVTSA